MWNWLQRQMNCLTELWVHESLRRQGIGHAMCRLSAFICRKDLDWWASTAAVTPTGILRDERCGLIWDISRTLNRNTNKGGFQ